MTTVMGVKTLPEMMREVRDLNTAKGWRGQSTTFAEYVALLHSEASECLEAYRSWKLGDFAREDGKPEGVASELADVLIRVLDMADIFGIDLEREYERKMAYNLTRPYLHGGKTL